MRVPHEVGAAWMCSSSLLLQAFEALFSEHGPEACAQVMEFHKANGGLGRVRKIK